MARTVMLADLQRCTGCWTCATACKIGNNLEDDEWWLTVKTLGNGEGIDRPAGIWPNLRMQWMPMYTKKCILCAPRVAKGEEPYCMHSCPSKALTFGKLDEDGSPVDAKLDELRDKGYRIFELPSWENTRDGIVYAARK